jgi:hypothetical protein
MLGDIGKNFSRLTRRMTQQFLDEAQICSSLQHNEWQRSGGRTDREVIALKVKGSVPVCRSIMKGASIRVYARHWCLTTCQVHLNQLKGAFRLKNLAQ